MSTKEGFLKAYGELIRTCEALGYGEELGKVLAKNIHSEIGLKRMAGYLRNARPKSMEEIADELVAINEDRQTWLRKKEAQEAGSYYNAWLNSDERETDD